MSPGRTPRLVSQELRAATALSKTGSARSPAASTACQCPPAGTALWPPAGTALWPPAASTMSRRAAPGHLLRLGLCDGLAAHEEDQRAARKRFHHGGEARPHRRRGAPLIPAPRVLPRRRVAASPE